MDMDKMSLTLRLVPPPVYLLFGCLLCSSPSSASRFLAVTSTVGEQALLPCRWKSVLKDVDPSPCHIQWRTIAAQTVFEQWGVRQWQADEYKDRVQVPEEKLDSGDCSLVISDVQMDDMGKYESFMVVDGERSRRTRVFIQGVKLSVTGHKSNETRRAGDDLVLDLRTQLSERVIFQSRNSSAWLDVWMRNDRDGPRLEKHPLKEQLTIKNLKSSDAGTYQVLDEHGRSVSSVQLSVEEGSREKDTLRDGGVRSSRSSLLVCFALVSSVLVHRLF